MEYKVTKGKTYLVTAKDETTVTDVESGYVLKVLPANTQGLIVAISDNIQITGECNIHPFDNATRTYLKLNPSAGGGKMGGIWVKYDENFQPIDWQLDELKVGTRWVDLSYYSTCFMGTSLTSFSSDLPALTEGSSMFYGCTSLTSFSSDLPSLTSGSSMFYGCTSLTSFSSDLPSLTSGSGMFYECTSLTSFSSDLPALMNGNNMFSYCSSLTSFPSDLPALTNGGGMFNNCSSLTSFSSDLPALTSGGNMFSDCKLNKESTIRVLNTIPTHTDGNSHKLTIGIDKTLETDADVLAAIEGAKTKGWTVTTQWN